MYQTHRYQRYFTVRAGYLAARAALPYLGHLGAVSAARYFRKMPRTFPGDRPSKKQKITHVGAGGQQLSYSRIKHGRKVAKRELLMRILASKLNTVSHRWQNVTNSASGTGAYTLNYFLSNVAGSDAQLPVFLWDLTCAQQQVIDGVQTFGMPCSRLNRLSATNVYTTTALPARDSDNAADTYAWTTERNSGLTNTKEYAEGVIENVSVKLLLYGARKFPSGVKVQLVQFDEGYTPNSWAATIESAVPNIVDQEPGGLANDNGNDWNAMWQQHIAPLVGNPINTRPNTVRKVMKVLMTKTYSFQPKLNTELDVTGDQVAVFFNYKMNKRVDYTRAQAQDQVTVAEEINPNEWAINNSKELTVHARPEQRVFLMISGMTPLNSFGIATPADVCTSFDVCIRRKITCIDV